MLKAATDLPKARYDIVEPSSRNRMTSKLPTRMAPSSSPLSDGAAPGGGWARGLLKLSIGRDKAVAPAAGVGSRDSTVGVEGASEPVQAMRDELGARLLVHDPATQAVRHLYLVHQQLSGAGWPGVETLPRQVMGRALAEAEMLDIDEPSPLMSQIIDRLRIACLDADRRAELEAIAEEEKAWEVPDVPEVSEATHEEYELMERSWIGTVPSGLHQQEREL